MLFLPARFSCPCNGFRKDTFTFKGEPSCGISSHFRAYIWYTLSSPYISHM